MLRNFLTTLYEAIRYHKLIAGIDTALRAGKFASLALLCGIDDYTKLFSGSSTDNHADVKQSQSVFDLQKPNLPDIESVLHVEHAEMIAELEKKLADDPEFACCSCERLLQTKNFTAFLSSLNRKNSCGKYSGHTCTCRILKPQTRYYMCVSTAGPF